MRRDPVEFDRDLLVLQAIYLVDGFSHDALPWSAAVGGRYPLQCGLVVCVDYGDSGVSPFLDLDSRLCLRQGVFRIARLQKPYIVCRFLSMLGSRSTPSSDLHN